MNGKLSLFIFLTILLSCNKTVVQNHEFKVIGHAVTGLYNPQRIYKDNTFEAVNYALNFPDLDGIEIDLQTSKDGSLWLYHDENLSSQTHTEGKISELSDNTLSKVEYSSINRERLTPLNMLDFSEVAEHFELFLDLKDFIYLDLDANSIENIINQLTNFREQLSDKVALKIILPDLSNITDFKSSNFDNIYTDVSSKEDAFSLKEYHTELDGVFIRNSNIKKQEVHDLLENELDVIIFDMRSLNSIRDAIQKAPRRIMVEEFRTALPEK